MIIMIICSHDTATPRHLARVTAGLGIAFTLRITGVVLGLYVGIWGKDKYRLKNCSRIVVDPL